MYLSFGLYVFATALVLVQGLTHHVIHDEELPVVVQHFNHSKALRRVIRWNVGNVTNAPYKMLVALKTDPGYKYRPSMVWVYRCGGFCENGLVSMANAFDMMNFNVSRENPKHKEEYLEINVKNHTKCECKCPMKASMCSPQQKFKKDTCECECRLSDDVKREQDKCRKNLKNMVWNNKECACECRERITDCMTGQHWNENQCRCVKRK